MWSSTAPMESVSDTQRTVRKNMIDRMKYNRFGDQEIPKSITLSTHLLTC